MKAVIISIFFVISGILGFISQLIYVQVFGASEQMDMYFSLISIPSIITGITPTIFASIIIPELSKYTHTQACVISKRIFRYLFRINVFFSTLGCLCMYLFLNEIYATSTEELRNLEVVLCVLIWVHTFFSILNGYLAGVHNYWGNFILISASPLLIYVCNILSVLVLGSQIGVCAIGVGTAVSVLIQFVIYMYYYQTIVDNVQDDFEPNYDLNLKQILRLCILIAVSLLPFTAFGSIAYQWGGCLSTGSVSYLGYSHSFSSFLSVLASMGVATVTFPNIAKTIQNGSREEINNLFSTLERVLTFVVILNFAIITMFTIYRVPVLDLLMNRGAFTTESVLDLCEVLPYYLLGSTFISILNIVRNVYYSGSMHKQFALFGLGVTFLFMLAYILLRNNVNYVLVGVIENFFLFIFLLVSLLEINRKYASFGLTFYLKNIINIVILYLLSWGCSVLSSVITTNSILSIIISCLLFILLADFVFVKIVPNEIVLQLHKKTFRIKN
jgi:putative peptidoglycan lipid II flippase